MGQDGPWRLVVSEIAEVHDISEERTSNGCCRWLAVQVSVRKATQELRRSNDALAMPRARCQAQFPAQDP